jgi:hypothetical protein
MVQRIQPQYPARVGGAMDIRAAEILEFLFKKPDLGRPIIHDQYFCILNLPQYRHLLSLLGAKPSLNYRTTRSIRDSEPTMLMKAHGAANFSAPASFAFETVQGDAHNFCEGFSASLCLQQPDYRPLGPDIHNDGKGHIISGIK